MGFFIFSSSILTEESSKIERDFVQGKAMIYTVCNVIFALVLYRL